MNEQGAQDENARLLSLAQDVSEAVAASTDIFTGFAVEVPLIDLALLVSVATAQLSEMEVIRAKHLLVGGTEPESARRLYLQAREAFDRLNGIVRASIEEAVRDPEVAGRLHALGPKLNELQAEFAGSGAGDRLRTLQEAAAAGRRLVNAVESGAVSREKAREFAERAERSQAKTARKKLYKKARGW